jgi:hypothetical protein
MEKRRRNEWFDEEWKQEINKKNEAYNNFLKRPKRAKRIKYEDIRRKTNKICRQKKRTEMNKTLLETKEKLQGRHISEAYKEIKTIKEGFQPHTDVCKNEVGEIRGQRENILSRWMDYFRELLNKGATEEQITMIDKDDNEMETYPPPFEEEIISAIQNLKNNKAPGKDGIHSELIKNGGPELIRRTHQLIGRIWEKEEIQMEWKTSITCPIHKKGDKLDCHNYRGISLLITVYKIYTNIIRMRLETYSESMIGEYQAGFRRERSVTDQLFTVKQLLEKFWEHDIDLYQIFVDFKQAENSIKREKLYTATQEMGIPNKLIRLERSTMTESKAQLRMQEQLREEFEVKQGSKQEDGLNRYCLF